MALKPFMLSNRAEWLKMRQGYIGGSEASAVVGMNPYMTNVELWELKTGRRKAEEIIDNPFVTYGVNAEEHLRNLFELDYPQYAVYYRSYNLWLNDDFPFAHASLDGWICERDSEGNETGRNGVLEIKTTNISRSTQREKWRDRIPDNYYIQVVHYLMVTGFDFAIVKAQLKYDYGDENITLITKHYKIERNEVLDDLDYLEKAERDFFEHIKSDTQPPLVLPVI